MPFQSGGIFRRMGFSNKKKQGLWLSALVATAIILAFYYLNFKTGQSFYEFTDGPRDFKGISKPVEYPPLGNATARAILGSSTWTLLHVMASRIPPHPSLQVQSQLLKFLELLSMLYPCPECSAEFRQLLQNHPPVVESGEAFQKWLCKTHNIVNKRLGKSIFDCSMLKDRWSCGCGAELDNRIPLS